MPELNLSLRAVINASGKMTALGGSAVSPAVAEALAGAAGRHVIIQELLEEASKAIAGFTGSDGGCATCGAAAGIAIAVAACIAGDNQTLIESLPNPPEGTAREIILFKGHSINFGAPIAQMIALGGGQVREIGQSNLVTLRHLDEAVSDQTAAVLYVKSHHAVQKGVPSWQEAVQGAHQHGLPIIIDAAAEEDLHRFIAAGADLVVYSGGKAVAGPTSGFICGKQDLIRFCLAQYRGVGRAMKTGKENIIALLTALESYVKANHAAEKARLNQIVDHLLGELAELDGIDVAKTEDEAGRGIPRAEIRFATPQLAAAVVKRLEAGDPALFTRNHFLNLGVIYIDPRPLQEGEAEQITPALKKALTEALHD